MLLFQVLSFRLIVQWFAFRGNINDENKNIECNTTQMISAIICLFRTFPLPVRTFPPRVRYAKDATFTRFINVNVTF